MMIMMMIMMTIMIYNLRRFLYVFLRNEILSLLLIANVKGLPVGMGAVGLKKVDLGCCRNLHSSEKLQLCEIITMMMMMVGVVYLKDHTLQLNLWGRLHFKK